MGERQPAPDLAFGDFTIVRSDERVRGPAGPLKLGHKAYRVLLSLADRNGELVTKDELFATIWDGTTVSESALTSVIKELRRALGDDRAAPRYIESVYGRGYRFLPPVSPLGPRSDSRSEGAAAASGAPRSVAVLPFANLTGDESQAYLCDGMAEELITMLSLADGLKVPARTSSFAYRDRDLDVREIGRQLGVAAIVEGSVRSAGARIRLTVQLIDAVTGFHIWSGNFDHGLGDLLDLQDNLARSVAAALGRKLGGDVRATPDPEAMRLHLQAQSLAGRLSGEALAHAASLLRQAIALDPNFARAHQGLAGVLMLAVNAGTLPVHARDEARRHAERALELQPGLAAALVIIACLDALRGDWREAERNFAASLALDASDPAAHEAIAHLVLLPTGQKRRAREHSEQALELAPARASAILSCALAEWMTGNAIAAGRYLDTATMLGVSEKIGGFRTLRAATLVAKGLPDEAGDEMAASLPPVAREAGGEEVVRQVYRAIFGMADRAAVSERVSSLFEACRGSEEFWRDPSLPGYLFGCQAVLGALDEAYRIAGVVVERGRLMQHFATPSLVQMWHPLMSAFRSDPRFHALVDDLGMLDYWETSGPPDGYALAKGRLVPA